MNRSVLMVSCLMLLAPAARAQGLIHLAVGDCGGAATITNDCTTNSGADVLVISMVSPVASSQVVGFEAIVNLTQAGVLSDWWRFDSAGCQFGRLTSDADFQLSGTLCNDVFGGLGLGNIVAIYPGPGSNMIPANSERLDVFAAVDALRPMTVDASTENSLFHLVIHHLGTLGPGACAGCLTPTALAVDDILIGQEPGVGDVRVNGDGSGQYVSYNGGNTPTPVRSTTWGAIKSLYR